MLRDCVVVCVILLRLLSCPGRTAIFPHAVFAFGIVVIPLGVILATIGLRMTQELFSVSKL